MCSGKIWGREYEVRAGLGEETSEKGAGTAASEGEVKDPGVRT